MVNCAAILLPMTTEEEQEQEQEQAGTVGLVRAS